MPPSASRPIVALCLAAGVAGGCKKEGEAPSPAGQGAPAAQAPAGGGGAGGIKIGATLPLTGSEARVGGFYKEGYEYAFAEQAKKGGLNVGGKKVPAKLVLLDDTTTQQTAVSLADRLINDEKVQFLLGTYASHLV